MIRTTPVLLEKKVVPVPSMGDSITEGTIVEWAVQVGQAVKEEDVICLIETDKVTVDIKAVSDGVLTQQFGAIDETVEVGGKLYEIDTEGVASVTGVSEDTATSTPSAPAESPKETVPTTKAVEPSPIVSTDSSTDSHRTPSIHFLGKTGWAQRLSGETPEEKPQSLIPDKPNGVVVLDGSMLTSAYGRLPFSDEEMEALEMGGANLAPSVIVSSGGAKFASM